MSKVINKKLHPYYKTGIYGWIGEEVDDNDYIICPICGEVLGMNYCDYAGEQGYNNQCPKCKQELDYSEIYDFEDTCYFEQLLEIKESRLADLEAKLAEKDKEIESKSQEIGILHNHICDDMLSIEMHELRELSRNQDKISFVVEQLEKVKEFCEENCDKCDDLETGAYCGKVIGLDNVLYRGDMSLFEFIDNQIEELKKEMK